MKTKLKQPGQGGLHRRSIGNKPRAKQSGAAFLVLCSIGFSFHSSCSPQNPGQISSNAGLDGLEDWIERQAAAGARTQALIVQKSGVVAAEIYREDFSPDTAAQLYSMTKSLTSLGMGAAVEDFSLDIDASVCTWIDVPSDQPVCATTLKAALQMSSGLQWTEDYSGSNPSDVLNMLYGEGALDTKSYVFGRVRQTAPGDLFRYSSGDTTLVAAVLHAVTGGRSRDYLAERIFAPVGLAKAVWEEDAQGTLIGAAGAHLTAREVLKIGETLLSEQLRSRIVSEDFFKASLTPVVLRAGTASEERRPYGYQWWLNSAGTRDSATDQDPSLWRYPNATPQTYAAFGHFGQMLVIIPEEEIIIVRLASDKTASFDLNGLIGLVRTKAAPAGRSRSGMLSEPEAFRTEARPEEVSASMNASLQVEPAVGYTALSYCSCRFVSNRSHEACLERVLVPGQPVIPVSIDSQDPHLVRSEIAKVVKYARYVDPESQATIGQDHAPFQLKKGCQIVPSGQGPFVTQ